MAKLHRLNTQHSLLETLVTTVQRSIEPLIGPDRPCQLVVGLSGGPDSTLLLMLAVRAARRLSVQVHAAHLNHGWRDQSDADARWCAALCRKLGVRFFCTTLQTVCSTYQIKPNGSTEALAREARRAWLQELVKQLGADAILLGHHAQDQQETFFVRLLRGSSLDGLCGIRAQQGLFIRPLLQIDKQTILALLAQLGQPFLYDASNNWHTLLRNRIRHQVLPALLACDQRFEHTLHQSMEMLQEENDFLHRLAQETLTRLQHTLPCGIKALDRAELIALDKVLLRRVLMLYLIQQRVPFSPSNGFLSELVRTVTTSKTARHHLHVSWVLHHSPALVWITKNPKELHALTKNCYR